MFSFQNINFQSAWFLTEGRGCNFYLFIYSKTDKKNNQPKHAGKVDCILRRFISEPAFNEGQRHNWEAKVINLISLNEWNEPLVPNSFILETNPWKLFVNKSRNNDKRRSPIPVVTVDRERSTTHASLIITTTTTSHNAAGQRINMASMAAVLSRAVGFGKHNVD